jgi:hypothetical protein
MPRLLIPISQKFMCGRLTPRTRVHAIPMTLHPNPRGVRTVCGSDVHLVVFGITNDPANVIAPSWPPPKVDRCEDCAAAIGTRGHVTGSHSWQVA